MVNPNSVEQNPEEGDYGVAIRQTERWRKQSKKQKIEGEMEFNPDLGDRLEVDTRLRYHLASKLGCMAGELSFPKDFEEIAEGSKPKGYIGFIEADGNRFGEILKQLKEVVARKSAKDQIAAYENFSKMLKETTKEAVIEATVSVLEKALRDSNAKLIPMRILFLGGDDVMLAIQAEYALEFADEFCRRFQEIAERKKVEALKDIQLPTFTMSAGVVIAHHNVPFLSLHRMSSELLKNAKKRSWKSWEQKKAGAVDFQIITGSNTEDLKTVREELYTTREGEEEILLTGRPYLVSPNGDELSELLIAVENLRSAGIPRSQLNQLSRIMRLGEERGRLAFHRWFLRIGGEGENELKDAIRSALKTKDKIPDLWKKDQRAGGSGRLYCPLMDVVELLNLFAS
ncbi:MAG: type III-B CRISPR-associated protein Cas10/Cmr2 [Armatimonadetes bacterium]|nr:type III-B CRISPR-associated protein Cas10/Cmr2 [Armatimonadota bacterium]MDW8027320.1 type III-B CRISPR-associated protein Cas10/Cmr2 [Armatimonadota bacterium]